MGDKSDEVVIVNKGVLKGQAATYVVMTVVIGILLAVLETGPGKAEGLLLWFGLMFGLMPLAYFSERLTARLKMRALLRGAAGQGRPGMREAHQPTEGFERMAPQSASRPASQARTRGSSTHLPGPDAT